MSVFDVDTNGNSLKAVRFSNGTVNSKDKKRLQFTCYTQKKEKESRSAAQKKNLITAEVDGLTYVGKNYGPSNRFSTDTCDYYFGVHDKTSGKIRVLPAELYQLEPWVEDKQDMDEVDSNKTFREKTDALAKEFGSGKSLKNVTKRDRNKLDTEMISSSTKTVIESSHTQEQAAGATEVVKTEASALPPHNLDAKKPDDVYKLKDIVSPELLSSMSQLSQVFYDSTPSQIEQWKTEHKFFSFVLEKLSTLSVREDARMLQCQCLRYLQCLMEVFLMKSHQFRLKCPLPKEWPIPVKDHILKTFTLEIKEPGKKPNRCVPARMRDLMLSHILVLCLKLSQFDLVLTPVVIDLQLAHRRLATHAKTLGCSIKKTRVTGSEVYSAVLTVPLTFPEIRDKAAKKRIF